MSKLILASIYNFKTNVLFDDFKISKNNVRYHTNGKTKAGVFMIFVCSVFNLLKVQPNYHLRSMCVIHNLDFWNYWLLFCMVRTWAETIQVFCFIFISDLYLLFWFVQICTSLTNALLLDFLKPRKVYLWIQNWINKLNVNWI